MTTTTYLSNPYEYRSFKAFEWRGVPVCEELWNKLASGCIWNSSYGEVDVPRMCKEYCGGLHGVT